MEESSSRERERGELRQVEISLETPGGPEKIMELCRKAGGGATVRLVLVFEEDGRKIDPKRIIVESGFSTDLPKESKERGWRETTIDVKLAFPLAQKLLEKGAEEVFFEPVLEGVPRRVNPEILRVVYRSFKGDPLERVDINALKLIVAKKGSSYGKVYSTPLGRWFSGRV